MFNFGFGEILVICVILIVVVGPERLPALMKSVGKGMRTVRQASRDIRATVGIDELMREDVLAPPPPRRPAPSATVSRALPAQAPLASDSPAPPSTQGEAAAPPANEPAPASGAQPPVASAATRAEDEPGAR
jgi:sec-independent protein translocase protein TatB